jgi:hypothetical protein
MNSAFHHRESLRPSEYLGLGAEQILFGAEAQEHSHVAIHKAESG